jgi:NAD(P)-dependent dehydrogenase (short-subunit alcohol dehydrogenase family)
MSIGIITGGSRGLGRSMALHLAERGHDIIFTFNSSRGEADEVVSAIQERGRQAATIQLNVAELESFDAFRDAVAQLLRDKWRAALTSTFW